MARSEIKESWMMLEVPTQMFCYKTVCVAFISHQKSGDYKLRVYHPVSPSQEIITLLPCGSSTVFKCLTNTD